MTVLDSEQVRKRNKIFSDNLLALRTANDLTVAQVALGIRITQAKYNTFELAENFPDDETLFKLARFFDTTISSLLMEGRY